MLKRLGGFFFTFRDILPVPLVLLLLKRSRFRVFGWLIGLPLIALGEAFRLWALMHIGPTTRTREVCADKLVQTGPYALVRNPLYLGNLTKICGLLCIGGDPMVALLALGFYLVEFVSIIAFEESFLKEKFGEEFDRFSKNVPMMFPRRFSCDGPLCEPATFSFSDALKSEKRTFGSTGTILGLVLLSGLYNSGCFGGKVGKTA